MLHVASGGAFFFDYDGGHGNLEKRVMQRATTGEQYLFARAHTHIVCALEIDENGIYQMLLLFLNFHAIPPRALAGGRQTYLRGYKGPVVRCRSPASKAHTLYGDDEPTYLGHGLSQDGTLRHKVQARLSGAE